MALGRIGSLGKDAGGGDDCENSAGVFGRRHVDQGDLPRAAGVAEGSAEGVALGNNRVPLRAMRTADAADRAVEGEVLDRLLIENEAKPSRERLTLIRLFEQFRDVGYEGGYDAVRRYAQSWRREDVATSSDAYVPLSFAPGEAFQFDWSHEVVLINGATVTVKVAQVRLCVQFIDIISTSSGRLWI